jgi:hypothetical protein
MKNGRWRVVALAGVSAGALAVLMVPGCGSSDNAKKVPTKFQPDAGDTAGEAGAKSSGSGGFGGSGQTGGNGGASGGEAGMTSEGAASGESEGGASGDASGTVLTGCALGDACCAADQCESGLNCLGAVCSCVAGLSNDYMLRTDGIAMRTEQNATTQTPVVNADTGMPLHGIVTLRGTRYHGCAVLDTTEVRCWPTLSDATGNNSGQLGIGTMGDVHAVLGGLLVKTNATTNLTGVVSIGADSDTYDGNTFTCAATSDGSAYCWGDGSGAVVNAATTPTPFATRILTAAAGPPMTGVTQVAVGYSHACALLTSGKITCWGASDGTGVFYAYPQTDPTKQVSIPGNVEKIVAGYWVTCALTDANGGSVYCWGDNNGNKLGIGPGENSAFPVRVKTSASAFLDGATDLVAAEAGGCVVRTDHTIYCWGGNVTGGYATEKRNTALVDITDAVTISTVAGPDNPRYVSTSGVYWIDNQMVTPNCGIEE